MALNFRLSYNDGFEYTDLFPHTAVNAIKGTERILRYSTVDVDIPASTDFEQIISLSLTQKQQKAPFYVELLTQGEVAKFNYATIAQIETTATGLKVTRLGYPSTDTIKLRLTFKEGGI